MTSRLLPVFDPETARFWAATAAKRLEITFCDACARYSYYPREHCPLCGRSGTTWREVSGRGVVYSFTVSRRPAGPAFADLVPYAVVLVDLDEGPRMLSRLRVDDVAAIRIGQRVQVDFEEISDGERTVLLPVFVPDPGDTEQLTEA